MNSFRLVTAAVVYAVIAGVTNASTVGEDIDVAVPKTWTQVPAAQAMGFPTIALKPTDERAAQLLITRLPPSPKMADLDDVRQLFMAATTPMQPSGATFAPNEFTTAAGKGFWASFEDPDLKGKPV